MEQNNRRARGRLPEQAPIRYCVAEEDEYRSATMFNYSASGMYMEMAAAPPKLGAHLLIEVLDKPYSEYAPPAKAKSCYYAKVIWKRNLPTNNESRFGIGVAYLKQAE